MDLQSLRIYVNVVETGSFTEGARLLFMAQSNASTSIANLEKELGSPLLIRTKGGVKQTAEGKALYEHARKILSLSDKAMQIGKDRKKPKGLLRIASMESTAVVRVATLFPGFTETYPEIRIQLKTGDTSAQLEWLKNGEVDFAMPGGKPGESSLEGLKLFDEELGIAFMKQNDDAPAIKGNRHFLVLPGGCSFRKRLEDHILKKNLPDTIFHEVPGIHTLYSCLIAGMGATVLPHSFLEYHGAFKYDIHFQPLPRRQSGLTIYGVWRKDSHDLGVLQAWISYLSDHIHGDLT